MIILLSGRSRQGATSPPPPPPPPSKVRMCVCIRMLPNKARIATERTFKTQELPKSLGGPGEGALTPHFGRYVPRQSEEWAAPERVRTWKCGSPERAQAWKWGSPELDIMENAHALPMDGRVRLTLLPGSEIIFPTAVPDPQYELICIQPIRDDFPPPPWTYDMNIHDLRLRNKSTHVRGLVILLRWGN